MKKKYHIRFTLIELLVVVSIIAMLASLLLPALSAARERGRSAKCMSNIKQIGMATHMYLDENDDFFPSARYKVGTANVTWYNKKAQLQDYLAIRNLPDSVYYSPGANTVLNCPSSTETYYYNANAGDFVDYCANLYLLNDVVTAATSTWRPYTKVNMVRDSASVVMYFDRLKSINYSDGTGWNPYARWIEACLSIPLQIQTDRHSGSMNAVWVDGHVSPKTFLTFTEEEFGPSW